MLSRLTVYDIDGQARARARAAGVRQRRRRRLRPRHRHRSTRRSRRTRRRHGVRARRRGARLEARAGRTTRRSMRRRSSRARLRDRRRTARRFPCSSSTARTLTQDGANPTLLYGYGGFNIARRAVLPRQLAIRSSIAAACSSTPACAAATSTARRGTSRRCSRRSRTTFDDMIAVAEWLIAEKYTQPAKLAVEGGSNGGPDWSARCSRSAPTCSARRSARCRCSTWCAIHKFLIARYWIAEYGDPDQRRRLPLDPPLLAVPERAHGREPAGDAGRRRRIRLARRSAAREEVRRCRAEQSRAGVAVPAVHGFRQRPRHRQDAAAARRSTATTSCAS